MKNELVTFGEFVIPACLALVAIAQGVKRKLEANGFNVSGRNAKALVFGLSCIISTIPALISMLQTGGLSWNTVGLWGVWVLSTWVPAMFAHGPIKRSFEDNGW